MSLNEPLSPHHNVISPAPEDTPGYNEKSEHPPSPFKQSAADARGQRRPPGSLMTTKGSNQDLEHHISGIGKTIDGPLQSFDDRGKNILSRGTDLQAWNNRQRDSTHTNEEHLLRRNEIMSSQADEMHPKGDSIIKLYTKQLMQSGRTDPEIVSDLEQYYNQLCSNCDMEILRLKEEYEQVQAEDRTVMAEELIHTHEEIERLGNFFIDCVYSSRKSMRLKLIR